MKLNSVSVFYYLCDKKSPLKRVTATKQEHKQIYIKAYHKENARAGQNNNNFECK